MRKVRHSNWKQVIRESERDLTPMEKQFLSMCLFQTRIAARWGVDVNDALFVGNLDRAVHNREREIRDDLVLREFYRQNGTYASFPETEIASKIDP